MVSAMNVGFAAIHRWWNRVGHCPHKVLCWGKCHFIQWQMGVCDCPINEEVTWPVRRGKLNSQFIVTRFSILHAGGHSLFRFHICQTGTFSMITRDKKLTILCSTASGTWGEVIKELLGSTVTTDHGTMQRLLPVTWTDINVRP